jgi:hypothetical protein
MIKRAVEARHPGQAEPHLFAHEPGDPNLRQLEPQPAQAAYQSCLHKLTFRVPH